MKQVNSSYRSDHKSIYIVPISDLHIGAKNYNSLYLEQAFKFIDKHRNNTRIILNGDLIEGATKTSVGKGVYDEVMNTQQQFEEIIRLFTPYKDIIDTVTVGNHELRIEKDTSFEILKEFCHRLGIVDRFVGFRGVVNYNIGDLAYSTFVWHGSTGSVREAGSINGLLGMRDTCIANCYIMGHTHKLLSFPRKIFVPNPDGDVVELEQLFINSGTALDEGDNYGAMKGFSPPVCGFGVIQMFGDKRKQVFYKVSDLI